MKSILCALIIAVVMSFAMATNGAELGYFDPNDPNDVISNQPQLVITVSNDNYYCVPRPNKLDCNLAKAKSRSMYKACKGVKRNLGECWEDSYTPKHTACLVWQQECFEVCTNSFPDNSRCYDGCYKFGRK